MTHDERQDELEAIDEAVKFLDAEIARREKLAAPPPTAVERWNERQATLPPERQERAIVSVLEQTLRHDCVTINMPLAEAQWHERQHAHAVDRHQRQQLRESDPMNVWHTKDED